MASSASLILITIQWDLCYAIREGFEGAQYFIAFLWTFTLSSVAVCVCYCCCNCSKMCREQHPRAKDVYRLQPLDDTMKAELEDYVMTGRAMPSVLSTPEISMSLPFPKWETEDAYSALSTSRIKGHDAAVQSQVEPPSYYDSHNTLPCNCLAPPGSFTTVESQTVYPSCSTSMQLMKRLSVPSLSVPAQNQRTDPLVSYYSENYLTLPTAFPSHAATSAGLAEVSNHRTVSSGDFDTSSLYHPIYIRDDFDGSREQCSFV